MGTIRGAILASHIPRLLITDPAFRAEYLRGPGSSFPEAYAALVAERLAGLDFETFVVVDTHWFATTEYVLNAHARHAGVYTSDELPRMLHGYAYDYAGDPTLAGLVAEEAAAAPEGRLRCVASRHPGLPMHYGTLTPMHFLNPSRAKRVLPVAIVQTAEPHNDLAFGAAIGRAVARHAGNVVLVASGGLSHRFHRFDALADHTGPDPGHVVSPLHRAMDERVLALMGAGRHADLLALVPGYRAACSPEGGFAHYAMLAGALGGPAWAGRGSQYGAYENAIGTGQAIVWFDAA